MPRPLSLLLALLLAVAACSGDDDSPTLDDEDGGTANAQPLPECDAALDDLTLTGELGSEPTIEFDEPFSVDESSCRVVTAGEGDEVADGDRVVLDVLLLNGRTKEAYGNSFEQTRRSSFVIDDRMLRGIRMGVVGHAAGSRVLVAIAPDDAFGPQGGDPAGGLEEDDTLVGVIDVHQILDPLERAEGTPVTPPDGLPTVTLDDRGAPTVEVPAGATAPAELVVQPLIEGSGPAVEAGQTILAHYHGVIFGSGAVFGSSWQDSGAAEFVIGAQQVIAGWDKGLVGKTVGSQVLLVVPPHEGYGEAGRPAPGGEGVGIGGTDTLVFVVDILAVHD